MDALVSEVKRMRLLISAVSLLLFLPPHGNAQTPAAGGDENNRLPVKRVVLYKNGVGYFEHQGRVQGKQDIAVTFTSGQLNDVLKSLTVLDLNGGRITGISYGSQAPMEKQLGDLRIPLGEKTSLSEFLSALRGARLEVRNAQSVVTGRLLSVERKTRISGGTTLEVDYISLVTDSGEVRTSEVSPAFSVRLLEHGLTSKVDRYLDLVSSERAPDARRVVISTDGTGERSLFVSYISEVPVWKSTWRIVLDPKNGPLLQGWAIVDNTVGEDWTNVELALVAGAPQSFVQNLSQPFYARRPELPVSGGVSFAPQTHEATLIPGNAVLSGAVTDPSGAVIAGATVKAWDAAGNLAGQTVTDAAGQYAFDSLPAGGLRLEISEQGFNSAIIPGISISNDRPARQDATLNVGGQAQTVTITTAASQFQPESAMTAAGVAGSGKMLGSGAGLGKRNFAPPPGFGAGSGGGIGGGVYRMSGVPAAKAQVLGDLFEYKLKTPITIRRNQSALVPIVQSPVTAEKVSIWNDQAGLPRPQRALWLTNTSDLTLDGGTFSVLEDETFAGEGIFDPIRPGERRLLSYAIDLAVIADSAQRSEPRRVARVRIDKGVLTQETEIREKKTYTFRNEDASPRTVIVEHPVRTGFKLRSAAQPVETTADWMRFRLDVAPKQTAALEVEEVRPEQATWMVSNITSDQLATFVQDRTIDKNIEAALRRVQAQKDVIDDFDSQKEARDNEAQKIYDDQQRLRENMKALKGSPEERALLQRYTQQLDNEETRLAALQKETEQIEAKKEAAQAELDRTIRALSFDVTL